MKTERTAALKRDWTTPLRWARYIIAFGILSAAGYAIATRSYVEQTVVSEVSSQGTVTTTTTAAPTLTSAMLLVTILLFAALLLPDLAELNVFGVGLKMKVEAVAKEAESARREVASARESIQELRVELIDVRAHSSATAGAFVQSTNHFDMAEMLRVLHDIVKGKDSVEAPRVAIEQTRDALIGEVITGWAELVEVLDLTNRLTVNYEYRDDDDAQRRYEARREFVAGNQEQLLSVSQLRNLAAHPTDQLRDDDLKIGSDALSHLINQAKSSLGAQDQR